MLWAPSASDVVANEAMPPDSAPVPSVLAPSLNVTVPPGVPEAGDTGATVAVKVTDCPTLLGLTEETTDVVVAP